MVHPLGDGTEADPPGVTGTVVHPPGEGTEVDPLGVAGTVVHPLGDGTEVDPPVAGVAIRLPRARSAADQQPLAAAGALCQPIFNTRSQLAALYLCLITSASSSNG